MQWFAAMLCILPFTWGRTLWAWALVMLASLASYTSAPWWLIDAAGVAVFACWPNVHSRIIAGLFGAMLVGDFGDTPWEVSMTLGWAMWCVLLVWSTTRPRPQYATEATS